MYEHIIKTDIPHSIKVFFAYSLYMYITYFIYSYGVQFPSPGDLQGTVAHHVALSMELSRQEYWSGLPCSPLGDLPNPEIELGSPALQADSLPTEPPGKPTEATEDKIILFQFIFYLRAFALEISTHWNAIFSMEAQSTESSFCYLDHRLNVISSKRSSLPLI